MKKLLVGMCALLGAQLVLVGCGKDNEVKKRKRSAANNLVDELVIYNESNDNTLAAGRIEVRLVDRSISLVPSRNIYLSGGEIVDETSATGFNGYCTLGMASDTKNAITIDRTTILHFQPATPFKSSGVIGADSYKFTAKHAGRDINLECGLRDGEDSGDYMTFAQLSEIMGKKLRLIAVRLPNVRKDGGISFTDSRSEPTAGEQAGKTEDPTSVPAPVIEEAK